MSLFKPTWLVQAVYGLTAARLKEQGIRAVFCDLDNTLLAWNNPDGSAELRDWLAAMHDADITVMVVSNNNAKRVGRALEKLDLPFVARAMKPLPIGINKAVNYLGLAKQECVMVGDQLLTDVAAGNLAGVRTILVQPLIESDAWNTSINRFLEKFVFMTLGGKKHLHYSEDLNGK
ncbi:YqeG family HAD IIIA-type phosphatase [Lacticaseibacillus mingshuiensis]|uniref:YqeG family HAD IIIA-type phosphatase n=1 Tax=Lacticaseibacillus mingshuiensis TaxID=2799574 RepID=UPI00194E0784|nr:YqeG family HAD IIIA-type phosphatase [Lacticaseibacillus mingshuiensis]